MGSPHTPVKAKDSRFEFGAPIACDTLSVGSTSTAKHRSNVPITSTAFALGTRLGGVEIPGPIK